MLGWRSCRRPNRTCLPTSRKAGPAGSSAPPFVNQLPAQRINFIQTDAPTTPNFLPPPAWINVVAPEMIFGKPPPEPPTLNAASGPIEIDTVVFDAFTATSGTFVASSPRSGATLIYGISGGTTGSTVLGGVTYDISKTGPYGTLYVNSTTGAYTFVPDSDAINALTAPTTRASPSRCRTARSRPIKPSQSPSTASTTRPSFPAPRPAR